MAKHIVLCSDGTGNTPAKGRGTNVWKIYEAVERHDHEADPALGLPPQIAFYDDGVGTSGLRLLSMLGGAFGWGLSRNIRELYTSLVLHYEPGDKVFLFGFSRGAFTVRSLAGMICRCGLLDRAEYLRRTPAQRTSVVAEILRAYRTEGDKAPADVRRALGLRQIGIEFLGVWDTVDAVGVPFDELKLIDAIWRKAFGVRLWGFRDRLLNPKVKHGCQALAIDDERRTFHPDLWAPRPEGNIEQVWFPGAHSNVGGGYPEEELSNVSLYWMMRRAEASGLRFAASAVARARDQGSGYGKIYPSRAGLGVYYRYRPRDISALCGDEPVKVHVSALDRVQWTTDGYAPTNLPDTFTVVDPDVGERLGVYERVAKHQAFVDATRDERSALREKAAKLAWRRAGLYYALLGWTAILALLAVGQYVRTVQPVVTTLAGLLRPALGFANQPMTWILRGAQSIDVEALISATIGVPIPGLLRPLLESLAVNPEIATFLLLAGGPLFWLQRVLAHRTREIGEAMWRDAYTYRQDEGAAMSAASTLPGL